MLDFFFVFEKLKKNLETLCSYDTRRYNWTFSGYESVQPTTQNKHNTHVRRAGLEPMSPVITIFMFLFEFVGFEPLTQ